MNLYKIKSTQDPLGDIERLTFVVAEDTEKAMETYKKAFPKQIITDVNTSHKDLLMQEASNAKTRY